MEVARKLGINIQRTKICGGGAKSPLWKKIIANVMNLKVDVLEVEEGMKCIFIIYFNLKLYN